MGNSTSAQDVNSVINMLKSVILLLRPHQWMKNLFIFIPLFFGRHLFEVDYLLPCIVMFFSYSLAASGIYCFNDIYDVEADRHHPLKSKRPIASGKVSKTAGYLLTLLCFAASFGIILIGDWSLADGRENLLGIIALYIVMNLAYCIRLKHLAIVDVFVIAVGFILRILVGGFASGIRLSHWLVLMTFLLALFLAFAKRRDDVVMYENSGVVLRKNVNRYNLAFLNQAISIVASITMVCYLMYTVSPDVMEQFHSSYVYLTSVFVLAGIIRYMQITIVDVKSGSPTEVLLKDRFVQTCIVGWMLTFLLIIYL